MPFLMKNYNWWEMLTERLCDEPREHIWTSGDEILCRTENAADTIADMIETLYASQGENVLVRTGYYDPQEDEKSGETDRYTGWWYVTID